jgi:hypothetical protein
MRRLLTLSATLAIVLAGCGGGGGGSATPQPPPQTQPSAAPTVAPQSGYVTPTFYIKIPARPSSKGRNPQYVSSGTLSVKVTLTADSIGINPVGLSGNPAVTNVSPTCSASGCTATVAGPPSPPGTDSFLIDTYDTAGAAGHALNAAQVANVTIAQGQLNSVTVTLGAIPATLSISNVPFDVMHAGTAGQTTAISVIATDGAGVTIPTSQSPSVTYVDANGAALLITVTDPDTLAHGSCVVNSGTSSCTGGAATTVTFSSPDTTNILAYDGLAENAVTLTASASTATNGTATFEPILNAPAFNNSQASPTGVALSSSAEVDLFAPSNLGSTGSESFTESGWTNSPYNHALTFVNTGSCTSGPGITATSMSDIATITAGANSTTNGTPFTATANGSAKPGSCPSKISDGLSSNTTEGSTTLTVTWTAASITGQSKRRK